MAVVYLAFARTANFRSGWPIKLIKRGMDTDSVNARLR
jgi:hypothetical protein